MFKLYYCKLQPKRRLQNPPTPVTPKTADIRISLRKGFFWSISQYLFLAKNYIQNQPCTLTWSGSGFFFKSIRDSFMTDLQDIFTETFKFISKNKTDPSRGNFTPLVASLSL